MDVGGAVEAMRAGKRVRRAGWNGKGMHIELQVPDANSKMTEPYVFMKTAQGGLIPWLCSQADLLASDWESAEASEGRGPAFPQPFVTKPTLAQVVNGARVEYQGKPGEVLTGWVQESGMMSDYRSVTEPEGPKTPRVSISANQPGSMMMTFLAPHLVPLEQVLRVSCAPDPAPEQCWKCDQSGAAKGGEAPCPVCHRTTVHASMQAPVLGTDSKTGQEFHSMAEVVREGHRRIRAYGDAQLEREVTATAARDDARVADALGGAASRLLSPESFVHGAEYISRTDCNRWIAGTEHMKGTAGQEIYGRLEISRDDRSKVTCPECLDAR